jgi:hypothetical protein
MWAEAEEEPDDPEETVAVAGPTPVPTVPPAGAREFEYRTELLTDAEITDGKTLAERLTAASKDGWDLVEVIGVRDVHALLLRRPKTIERESRSVGFAPPRN